MKKLFAIVAASFMAVPVNASPLKSLAPNTYVVQEHTHLNPEIWEYERPLKTVIHHTEPKKCEGEERCVELDIVLEGPDGKTYNPSVMDDDTLVFVPNFILHTNSIRIQCNEASTTFRIMYPHVVRTWNQDSYGRRYISSVDDYPYYSVSTYKFQKEMCKYSFSKERRQAIEVLDTLACAFDPKRCKK